MHDPDEFLVHAARRGDSRAFEQLVERHERKLFTLAARTLGSPDEAADAVQEAFIRAWQALPRFRGGSLFSTWLYRICLNAAHDVRTKAQRVQPALQHEAADPRDELARSELSSDLQKALDSLDEDFRLAVVLYDVLGCSYAEIAELQGVAEGTVKSRIFRGRSELARKLGTPTRESGSNP